MEEELLLVDPGTGYPLAVAETALLRVADSDDTGQEGMHGNTGEPVEFELQQHSVAAMLLGSRYLAGGPLEAARRMPAIAGSPNRQEDEHARLDLRYVRQSLS